MANSILQNEETMQKFLKDTAADYDRFKSDRETFGFDEKMKLADGMWRCYQNRALADAERTKTSDSDPNKASVGSIRFFRMVSQKASLGNAVSGSVDVPFKYKTVSNPEVWGSAEEAESQAAVHNALARYSWKTGDCDTKMYSFWFQEHKYCNVPVQVVWNEERRRVAIKDPKTKKISWKEKVVNAYPTFRTLHWSMVYADMYSPDIANQPCVVVLSVVPWITIQQELKRGRYDKEAIQEIRENLNKYKWNGTEGADARAAQVENSGNSGYSPGESELFLIWDIYRWAPIKSGNYDDEADYQLYWCTAIGNALNTAIPVRMETDFDPDGEVPIRIVKAIPDDADLLYSMSWAEVIRAQYSIECTLWEETIDNISGVNSPPVLFDSALFKEVPDDFRFTKGQKYDVDDVQRAIAEFAPRDTTSQTAQLINLIQEEQGVATNMNKNMMGEAYGGRTPASEGMAINRFSQQPNLGETSYILNQLLTLLGRKYKSYWQAFGDPTQIKQIADEQLDAPVYQDTAGYKIYGDFDIEVDVVDEFVEDFVQAGQELQLMQTVASNPVLVKSDTHKVDLGKWLSSIMRRLKTQDVDEIIIPAGGVDAHLRQREETRYMIATGELVQPQQGEDHEAHIAELNGEILRWKPLVEADLGDEVPMEVQMEQQKGKDILTMLLYPHLEAHKQMMMNEQNQQAAAMNKAANGGMPQQEQPGGGQPTPGQMAGGVPGGMLGAMAGGNNGK